MASGVPELAAWLAAQTAKPVYAYADGLCASAAYYLAAATGRVYAPATATVGSIGVICRHMDWSGFLEKCGVRVTHLTGGAWKAAGNDAEPLTDGVKAYLQQPINELHTMFRADVAAHMPVDAAAPETWGDGQVFLASRAHELGLVTGIVPGMDALIALINTTKEKPMDRIELASSHPELLAQIEADAKKQGAAEANAAMETQQQQAVQAALDNRMALFAAVAGAEAAQRVETLAAAGITPDLVRMSCGIEDAADLIALEGALDQTALNAHYNKRKVRHIAYTVNRAAERDLAADCFADALYGVNILTRFMYHFHIFNASLIEHSQMCIIVA